MRSPYARERRPRSRRSSRRRRRAPRRGAGLREDALERARQERGAVVGRDRGGDPQRATSSYTSRTRASSPPPRTAPRPRRRPASPSRRRSAGVVERARWSAAASAPGRAAARAAPVSPSTHDLRRPPTASRPRAGRGPSPRARRAAGPPSTTAARRRRARASTSSCVVAVPGEDDTVGTPRRSASALERRADTPRPARGRGRRARRARPGRSARASISSRCPFTSQSLPDLADQRRRVVETELAAQAPVRRGRLDVDAVVEHLDALRIALALVRVCACSRRPRRVSTRAVRSCCRTFAGGTATRGGSGSRCAGARSTGTPDARPARRPRAFAAARVCVCSTSTPLGAQEPSELQRSDHLVRAADVAKRDLVAEVANAVDEGTTARRHEQHVVAARAKRVREPKRDELSAGDVSADHELRDLHARQTATSSVASAIASRSIAMPSSATSAIAAVPVTASAARRTTGRRRRRPSTSSRRSVRWRAVSIRRWPNSSTLENVEESSVRSSSASNSRSWNGLSGRTLGSSARGVERTRRPPGFEHSRELGHEALGVRDVLDDLERADDVEGVVGERKLEHVGDAKLDVRPRVVRVRIRHCVVGDVDADDTLRDLRKVGSPVADAAARVEHARSAAVRQRELVALEMQCDDAGLGLVRDDPLRMAHRSLTASKYPDGRFDGRLPPAHTRARRPGDDCRNDSRVRPRIRVDPLLAAACALPALARPARARCAVHHTRAPARGPASDLGVRDRRRRPRRARPALGALVAETAAQRRPRGPLRACARDVRRACVGGVGTTRHGVARRRRCAARSRARRLWWPRPARGRLRPRRDACDDRVRGALPGARRGTQHRDDGDGARRSAGSAAGAAGGAVVMRRRGRAAARAARVDHRVRLARRAARSVRRSRGLRGAHGARPEAEGARAGRRRSWAARRGRRHARARSAAARNAVHFRAAVRRP